MHSTNTASAGVQLAIIAVVFILLLVRRLQGRRVNGRRSLIIVIVLLVLGVSGISQALNAANQHGLSHGDLTLLAILVVFSLIMGMLRGTTVKFFMRDGELHSRYTAITVVLWLVTFASRLAFTYGASHFSATESVIDASLIMMFGISVIGEAIVVQLRTAGAAGRATPLAS
jgi:hypothetical protein